MSSRAQRLWEEYRDSELARLNVLLAKFGFALHPLQPHIQGERYLMSGRKLVLVGKDDTGVEVVIKASSDPAGMREIAHEHEARIALERLPFAYTTLPAPQERLFTKSGGFTLLVTTFIAKDSALLDRPLPEQFSLLLAALKAQEGIHATAYAHEKEVRRTFGIYTASLYQRDLAGYTITIGNAGIEELRETLARATSLFADERRLIDQYCGFLTHRDFVPHNLCLKNGTLYLLDQTSLHFGNKYESWGRLLNFLLLYNRPLEGAFLTYIGHNRLDTEGRALRLMRIYKLGFLLSFYAESLPRTSGDLHTLTKERLLFWGEVLRALLEHRSVSDERIHAYQQTRDALRSPDEKVRQSNLH